MSGPERLSDRALNRALLARQGLLARFQEPLVEVVEAIGAMQGQSWAALPVGLWSRMAAFGPGDLYAALERGELLWGIGIRGTLHLVSARQHPAYAAIAATTTGSWHRAIAETTPAMGDLRGALLEFAGDQPRTNEEIREFAEAWVGEHRDAIDPRELEAQRSLKWRPDLPLERIDAGAGRRELGSEGAGRSHDRPRTRRAAGGRRASSARSSMWRASTCAPSVPRQPRTSPAGSAGARRRSGSCSTGLGTSSPPSRTSGAARCYDLPEAPGPTPTPPSRRGCWARLTSTLLAYAAKRRERILPESLRDVVYQKANLQIRPTLLIDGLVAGTWSIDVRRGEATLTLRPAGELTRAAGAALSAEGTGLLEALHPSAKAHRVRAE